jgi:hypothetical protein
MSTVENIIVGAGPYGLSIAAHLRASHVNFQIAGQPMESWRKHMPAGMALKSEPLASNLSDADGRYTLQQFCALRGRQYHPKGVPLPLQDFVDYATWFQQQAVPDIKNGKLIRLARRSGGFELAFDDGEATLAKRVILAMGHLPFRYIPPVVSHLPKELVSHSSDHSDLSRFAGKDVTIIGCGQSALETAALLREAGASVRVLARAPTIEWNADIRPTDSLIERWLNPDAGLGPGWRNVAKSELPRLFSYLPVQVRHRVVAKANGPAGSWWLKDRLIGKVPMLIAREIISATEHNGRLRLSVRSGVRAEQFSTDHVIAGTGYKVDVNRLSLIDETLRSNIKTFKGAPVLNSVFESSVPGLHFVGLPSALSFGPVMRFVYGTKHAAAILTPHIRSATRQTSRPLRAAAGDRIPQPQDI